MITNSDYHELMQFYPQGKDRGRTVTIDFCQNEAKPWAASFSGASHFFKTARETLAYCCGRSWISIADLDRLAEECEKLAHIS